MAAPTPLTVFCTDPSSDGISCDVRDRCSELLVVLDPLGLEGSLEHMAITAVSALEVARVRAQQTLHPAPEIRQGRADDDVEVVAHEAIRADVPAVGLDYAFQDDEEDLPISVVPEYVFAIVAAWEPVMRGTRFFIARLPRHIR